MERSKKLLSPLAYSAFFWIRDDESHSALCLEGQAVIGTAFRPNFQFEAVIFGVLEKLPMAVYYRVFRIFDFNPIAGETFRV